MGIDRRSGVGGGESGIDRQSGVGRGERGDRYGDGVGESEDRQEEWGRRGREW